MKKNSKINNNSKEKHIELIHKLDGEGIDLVSECIINYFTGLIDKQKITRIRLSIEESLGLWCENAKENDQLNLTISQSFSGYKIRLLADGPTLDPYAKQDDSTGNEFSNRLLVELGLVPEYYRDGNKNGLYFKINRKPMNPILKILLVIVAAIIIGMTINALVLKK